MEKVEKKLCAVYTRKSHEEGLEQSFNSLDAQRMACESYIQSQQFNGWTLVPKHYDDGGWSGGNTDRPALKELLADIEAGKINVVVIYKIDRLSRSLTDFAELQRFFEKHGVSFVSVTQQIDTSGSSGRMLLNILMTFAQFEREQIAERIRDKVSATRRQGKFAGGTPPFGYRAENRKLVVQEDDAKILRRIFDRYLEIQSPKQIAAELNADGIRTRRGMPWTTSHIYRQLNSRACIGEVEYKGEVFQGEHEAIIDRVRWDEAQRLLAQNSPLEKGAKKERESIKAPLKGLLKCGHCGCSMLPHYARKKDGRRYYYYICMRETKRSEHACPVHRVPGGDMERLVMDELGAMFKSPSFRHLLTDREGLDADEVARQLADTSKFWDGLYPAERQRLMRLLVEKAVVFKDSLEIEIKTSGMKKLYEEMANGEVCSAE